jgi:hypothetical protein
MKMAETEPSDQWSNPNSAFHEQAIKAFRRLFDAARAKNELHFALSLNAEFRGSQDPGWNTAAEAHRAFNDYLEHFKTTAATPFNARLG